MRAQLVINTQEIQSVVVIPDGVEEEEEQIISIWSPVAVNLLSIRVAILIRDRDLPTHRWPKTHIVGGKG